MKCRSGFFVKPIIVEAIISLGLAAALAMMVAVTLVSPAEAAGTGIDIQGAGNVTINSAIFSEFTLEGSTGTGVFQPFLHVHATGKGADVEEGYNTDYEPPEFDGQMIAFNESDNMKRFCLNRHSGAVNCLFMSLSVDKVGLKSLWRLRWHRMYDVTAEPPVWPSWMNNLPEG